MTINGTPVVFTLGSSVGVTVTELPGALFQSATLENQSKRSLVMDGNGARVTSAHTDQIKLATLEWKVGGTGIANAILNTALQLPGAFVTITACTNLPALVSASKWEVIKPRIKEGNEEFATITMEIEQAPNITGPAAA
jgi:hypothetical protein